MSEKIPPRVLSFPSKLTREQAEKLRAQNQEAAKSRADLPGPLPEKGVDIEGLLEAAKKRAHEVLAMTRTCNQTEANNKRDNFLQTRVPMDFIVMLLSADDATVKGDEPYYRGSALALLASDTDEH